MRGFPLVGQQPTTLNKTARATEGFRSIPIHVLKWPGQTPELNPILKSISEPK